MVCMCGTFCSEPAVPRTRFREAGAADVSDPVTVSVAAQAMANVLVTFPDAYQAVLAEIRRLRPREDRAP